MPFFSIIIPTFNRGELALAALESVANQRCDDYEVIVVDDGSTDGTYECLRDYKGIKVIQQPNAGPGAARNRGVAAARGRYIAFLDSDDLFFPWSLALYHEIIDSEREPAFLAGRPFQFTDPAEPAAVTEIAAGWQRYGDYLDSSQSWPWFGVSSFVIRTDAFRQAGGFAEKRMNGEDADLALRLGTAAGFIQVQELPTFAYRGHAGNIMAETSLNAIGIEHLVAQEMAGRYPGGPARHQQRREIITRHVRPHALACLESGRLRDGLRLYRQTILWNWRDRRLKFLLAFPLLAATKSLH